MRIQGIVYLLPTGLSGRPERGTDLPWLHKVIVPGYIAQ